VITQSGTGTNALKGSTFSGSNTHFNGSNIIQYDSTNVSSTSLLQSNTSTYLIENLYNSSEIRLRNKNASGGSVDYVFSYNGATLNNNVVIPSPYSLVFSNGANQTNIGQSSSIFVCWNLTNSGQLVFRTRDSTGTADIDGITTSYTGTTINNTLTCNKNITLQSNFVTPTSGQLGYIYNGNIVVHSPAQAITSGTTYYVASMNLPTGIWNVFGAVSFTPSSNGTLNETDISISQTFGGTTIDYNNAIVSFNSGTLSTGYYTITRINTILTNTSSSTVLTYLNFRVLISSGAFQLNTTSDGYTKFYAVRIASNL
jgi:hypothetical protein